MSPGNKTSTICQKNEKKKHAAVQNRPCRKLPPVPLPHSNSCSTPLPRRELSATDVNTAMPIAV